MSHNLPTFNSPTRLPSSTSEASVWQKINEKWWNENPMRYDWKTSIPHAEFSQEFFNEIDRRFIESSRHYLPWKKIPFDGLIDYDGLHDKDVLEIGIGNGTHAQLIAHHAKSFTGIDITDYAVASGKHRLGSKANIHILRMDAENLEFGDASFDFVWSWGVIHHSSNTKKIVDEIARVLKPGGRAVLMVYHRGWYNYYLIGVLIYGLLFGGFLKKKSLHTLIQEHTDGAIARYYSTKDFSTLLPSSLSLEKFQIAGQKNDILPLPGSTIKEVILRYIPDSIARFMTHTLQCGSFLIVHIKKN